MLRGIPRILDEFERRAPGIEVALHEMPSSEQLERLRHAGLSAGFLYGVPAIPELASIMMQRDFFVLCMRNDHPKANLPVIHLRDVADETFLMFKRDVNPVNHDAALALFNRAGIYPRLVHSIRNWLTMVAMVSEGCGMAIVSGSIARLACSGVRMLPLAGEQAGSPASLVWNHASSSPALRQFVACAQEMIDGQQEDSSLTS